MKVVLYHKNCQDGLFSAFNFWKKFGDKKNLYIPVNYGVFKNKKHSEVLSYIFHKSRNIDTSSVDLYVVDFCFPIEFLIFVKDFFRTITILDHHESSMNNYLEYFKNHKVLENGWIELKPFINVNVLFSKTESGALMTYRYLFPEKEVPYYIKLVSDRDLWEFKEKDTDHFYLGCEVLQFIVNPDFNEIEYMVEHKLHEIIGIGKKYQKYLESNIERISKSNAKFINIVIDGIVYDAAIVNSRLDIASDLGNYILKDLGVDIVLIFNIFKDGSVQFSVRSRKEVDSSVISTYYGGGGHKNASGFFATIEDLCKIMSNNLVISTKRSSQ